MTPRPSTSILWPLLLLLFIGGVLSGMPAPPAAAHPFGDPQTLEIEPAADGVSVRWQAAADDLTSLALRLDVLDGPRSYVYRDGAMVPQKSEDADAERLAQAPELEAYLLSRIEVLAGETACTGALAPVEDLPADGALLKFSCPDSPGEVEVRARMLTDLHAAYRTLATGPAGQTHIYSVDSASNVFDLESEVPDDGPTAAQGGLTLIAWACAGFALLVVSAFVSRHLRRRAS